MFGDGQRGAVDGGEGAGVRVAGGVSGGGGGGGGVEVVANAGSGGLGGGCQPGLTVGGYISIGRWDFATEGHECNAYDRIPPYSSSSLFYLLPPISEASRSASWTHKTWILVPTYLPTGFVFLILSFSAILFRSLLRYPPRLLCND